MISILRLGHRGFRDARISTHCGLVARAFGADCIVYSGEKDQKLLESVNKVVENWGGAFYVSYEKNWKKIIKDFKGIKVHLTVYGLPIQKEISKIRKAKDVLVIVGGEKVPSEVYNLVDYNIAVTSQPHSEIAALAIFLDKYFKEKELVRKFKNARLRVMPQKTGKKVAK